ncbi:AAA family ATPase [Thermomonospora umbrina]|uniref:Orc1-like AAA ATPase domain-containing protein n=1 Tax=Thermomonospora umbrina TaxID=111806 RepID=A0A3D9SPE7_9ACTN|nr:AAA family ATPase [Thermomonospora umbrina]REE97846.1 hypothetical protein DFJ69_3321 [Thermomonospora umbrina]
MGDSRTIADRLRAARRRRFIGRTAELESFRAALTAQEPPFAVMFVHGVGGVGKTALLDALAEVAEEVGAVPARLDARTVDPSPAALSGSPVWTPDPGTGRRVLLLDAYERLTGIDDWIRGHFLPELPAGTLVVVAGREPPPAGWTTDQGWRELLHVVPLRNLPPEDGAAYLRAERIPERLHRRALAATHGHPLALALLADVLGQRKDASDLSGIELGDAPDAVRVLLDRFLEEVPTERHRRALEVCAHALLTTEELLRACFVGPDDAGELFEWMRRLSFVEEHPEGLRPHDLAREVFDTDLRWRDRDAYLRIHRQIRKHLLERVRAAGGRDQQRLIAELTFLQRVNPAMRGYLDWTSLGAHHPDVLRDGDRDAIVAMTERYEGAESARLVAYWMDRQPDAFVIVRDPEGEALGYGVRLRLDRVTAEDREVDPGARAMWEFAHRHGPPAPGEEVTGSRFVVDRDSYQEPSVSFNVVLTAFMQQRLLARRLSWDILGAYSNVEGLDDFFEYGGFHRAAADFQVAGRRYQVFARDYRRGGLEAWLDLLAENELHFAPSGPAPARPAPMVALSRPDFATAVRQALRDLHRPDALAHNPLAGCRVVRERGNGTVAATLAGLLQAAADTLRTDPRGAKPHRAVDRTYLRPAPTQERAAELLGLPFSTYRRHLSTGLNRIVDVLWQWELYGTDALTG